MSKVVENTVLLKKVLEGLAAILEQDGNEDPGNIRVYERLKEFYAEEAGEEFDENLIEKKVAGEVTSVELWNLLDHWKYAISWETLAETDYGLYQDMLLTVNAVKAGATIIQASEEVRSEDDSPKRTRTVREPKLSQKEITKNHKLLEDFLNGSWITSLLVVREGERKDSNYPSKETFGEFSVLSNDAAAILVDNKPYMYAPRAIAISHWFSGQIKAYFDYLRGVSSEKDEFLLVTENYMSSLLSGTSSPKSKSTEKDWSAGLKVQVTFVGANLPGVALRVEPVAFTEKEIAEMAKQIEELNKLAKKAKGLSVTPDSISYAEDICVKMVARRNKFEEAPAKYNKYDLSLINIDRPAEDLVDQIKNVLSKPIDDRPELISMLFYGVPGSGKSQLASYIGKQLGKPVIKRTYAELQSMYVGEGEKQLQEAFQEAESENAIFLIDELDSIAGNRSKADRNYQKTFVNQLLTELDEFKGIFIATSNHMTGLDPAILRRLFLKIEFNFMSEEQVQKCFELYFPKLAKSKLGAMNYLTPGDFRAVQEASLFESKRVGVKRVRELLNNEIALKKKTLGEVIKSEKKIGYDL